MTGADIKDNRLFAAKLKLFFSLAGHKRRSKFEIIKLWWGLIKNWLMANKR
jgi:hypothetical protein